MNRIGTVVVGAVGAIYGFSTAAGSDFQQIVVGGVVGAVMFLLIAKAVGVGVSKITSTVRSD